MEKLVWLREKVSLAQCAGRAGPFSTGMSSLLPALPAVQQRLLLDGSRQLSLALPGFAAQAEMNIQELERHSHLWCRGLWAGSSREAPCPAACQSCAGSQLPSPAARPPLPPLAGQEAALAQLQRGTGQPGPGAVAVRSWPHSGISR